MKIEIVCASHLTEDAFWDTSALGLSLAALGRDERIITRISYDHQRTRPELYNRAIDSDEAHEVLLFLHDDVWLHDFYFIDRIVEGLTQYDVIGLAGSRVRTEQQIAWFSKGKTLEPNRPALSGLMGRGATPLAQPPEVFGPAPAACELLDGRFLAMRKAMLHQHGVRFDPQFDQHFEDMDFCRSARAVGLRLGTWRISVTHQSTGNFTSPAWQAQCDVYLDKWKS